MAENRPLTFDLEAGIEGLERVVVGLVFRWGLDLLRCQLKVLPFAVLPEGFPQGLVAVRTGLIPHVADVRVDIAERAVVG